MWLIICAVILWFLCIWAISSVSEDGDGIGVAFIVIAVIGALTHWQIEEGSKTVSYFTEGRELQQIEGEYLIPQGNAYVMKWDDRIRIISTRDISTVQSDSSYFEVEYEKTIRNYTKSRQRWIPGKQEDDTTHRINKYYLYRDLNE